MSNISYKFRLDLSGGIANVYPIHEDLVLSSTRTNNNKYLTSSINTKFSFVDDDFEAIMLEDIEWEFTLRIDKIGEDGVVVEDWKTGTFTKLDGEIFNEKFEKRIDVSIELSDLYKKIQDEESKEFDFFDLNIAARKVRYDLEPLFQIYNAANGKISNHIKGNYWEEFADNPIRDETELNNLGFQKVHIEDFLRFGMGFGEDDINGNYVVNGIGFRNENNLYDVEFTLQNNGTDTWYTGELIRVSDGVVLFEYDGQGLDNNIDFAEFIHVNGEGDGVFKFQGVAFYSRVLVGIDAVSGQTVIPIPSNDISTQKINYSHVITGSFVSVDIVTSIQTIKNNYPVSNVPTGTNENRYFVELTSPPTWYPVLKSSWIGGAIFMSYGVTGLGFFNTAKKEIKNDYCYELVDVVRAMMSNMVEGVSVGDSLGEFFGVANNNPLTGEAWSRVFITHKTNIKVLDFENPATKQSIRFSDIKNLMEFGFNCFPYLEGSELRFEHNLFFENGKSYTVENIGVDLTLIEEGKNEKKWVYDTEKWKYAKEEIPSEIKTKWSDSGSNIFDGVRIKLLSKYAGKGDGVEKVINNFMSDLNYIMVNPDEVGDSGFVLLFVGEDANGNLKVNYQDIDGGSIQNGKGAIKFLHDKFHKNGLPCKKVEINGVELDASSVKRTRIQEIIFGDGEDIDNLNLVKTTLGDGEIEKWDINLEDNSISATLRHNID